MDDNNKKPNKVNMPKFNLNWMYMIIALMLLGLWWSNQGGTVSKQVPYDEFQQYVRDGYVNKVVGYDDSSVEVYIKPQFVGQVFKQDSNRVGKNPMIVTEAPTRESLGNFIDAEKKEGHFDGSISYDKKNNLFNSILINFLPIIFLIALWIFFMRRMSGGAGGGGFQCRKIQSTTVRERKRHQNYIQRRSRACRSQAGSRRDCRILKTTTEIHRLGR